MRTLLSLGLVVAVSAMACGDGPYGPELGASGSSGGYGGGSGSSGGYGYGDDAGISEAPEAGASEAGAVVPPISTAPPGNAPALCADGEAPKAYLWAQDGTLFSFDPGSLETLRIGVVSCGTSANPWTLSVTTSGTAYVLYDDWTLYDVNLETLACTSTAYQSGQLGFIGREGITVGAGNTADRLYVYGDGASPMLGLSDLSSFALFEVGAITPAPAAFPVDLRSDAYGRLFALATGGTLEQIDPATGVILGEDQTGFEATMGGWALMAYEDQLYFFGGYGGGVSRYDVATKALFPVGQVNQTIVGASATPCLSASASTPPGDDAGSPEAGAPAAPSNPFTAGDAWMGTYVCEQGLTNLALVVESVDGNTIDARFDYDWIAGSTQGSYVLTGTYDPTTREATFTPGAWVLQPGPDWAPVGMDGYVDLSGLTYSGSITYAGCGAFDVTR
jgi:hypothetical protein